MHSVALQALGLDHDATIEEKRHRGQHRHCCQFLRQEEEPVERRRQQTGVREAGKQPVQKDLQCSGLQHQKSPEHERVQGASHRITQDLGLRDAYAKQIPETTRHVVETIEKILKPARKFEFWASDEEFYKVAAKTPRSNCVMDVTKLLAAGVTIRGVEEALEDSLKNWRPEK